MKEVMLFLFVLNILCSSVVSMKPRLKRNSGNEFDSSLLEPGMVMMQYFHFQQKLDHFNPAVDQNWSQRYWVTVTYYRKPGPAFLFVNRDGWDDNDQWLSYAEELNAICFSLEHRFYGESWPTNGTMHHHLSSEQALGDIENFIKRVTEDYKLPKQIKWIVFGCSYAGALAAWARLKYPYLIHGAIVSSAPLLTKVDYCEFEQIVEESLKSYDPKCVESITHGIEDIVRLNDRTEDIKNILQMFYLCDNSLQDITSAIKIILVDMINIFSKAVQYNNTMQINIPTVCEIMTNNKNTKLNAFAKLRNMYKELEEGYTNIKSKNHLNTPSKDHHDNYHENRNLKSWRYQRCSEFGLFSSYTNVTYLSAAKHLFPIETSIKNSCKSFFGPNIKDLNEKISRTNLLYGGLDINVENMLFIYGSLDPWYKAGLYKKANSSLYETIFIKGTSHCADANPDSDRDISELKNARKKILETLRAWLKKNSQYFPFKKMVN